VFEFDGNYSAWRAAKLAEREAEQEARAAKEAARKKAEREREAAEKKKAGGKGQKNKKGKPGGRSPRNPYMFEKLEKKIMELEAELETLNAAMATEEVYSAPDRLRDTQFRIAEVESELERSNEEWMNWETA
jgi:hypothetical protein